ncbi:DUF2461 domain-containing protein [Hoylesella pleuritidis]|uniref:DUF2461 domain-containing protein n=1 Tax=Hoylesella pleuritidis TaxID=407975 RepID=UPI0023570188|nr:DUF2461 domain-containing protein [Hoylesella pleuritidis]
MQAKRILAFLTELTANNNRSWFLEHKKEYSECRVDFEAGIAEAIARISEFDPEIAHLQVKDCVYRFNRDTRFSPDKSPYKNHLGAYICARGKKALRGGYYLHLEPGNCLVAVGGYWLPTNILTSCRNEIMSNIEEWRRRVENTSFIKLFGRPGKGKWENSTKGFGLELLKTTPSGFPRDYEFIQYLRMKDYCSWTRVSDTFFEGDCWLDEIVKTFQVAKPMMDFINAVVDDYE